MEGWKEGQMDRQRDGGTDEWTDGWTDRQQNGFLERWTKTGKVD